MIFWFVQGQPYPQQDQNAVDAIMQFAIHELKFQPDEILLFGWSIGGYSSLVGAVQYPEVKGVVSIKTVRMNIRIDSFVNRLVTIEGFRCNFR